MAGRIRIDPTSRLPIDLPDFRPLALPEHLPDESDYVELGARSNFSFLQAASSPESLVQLAAEEGHSAIGIADRDGLYGMVRAHEEAKRQNIRLVVGCELSLDFPDRREQPTLLVHVENQRGYTNLCRILTESHRLNPKGVRKKTSDALEAVPKNLFAGAPLSFACENAEGLWAMVLPHHGAYPREQDLELLKEAFGARASIGVHRHLDGEDRARVHEAKRLSSALDIPICATNSVRYARRDDKPLFDVLHCIREGTTLDAAGRGLSPNTEACLKSPREMAQVFAGHPAWLLRSRKIADGCRFTMSELKYRFPCELDAPAFPGETPDQALRRITMAGAGRLSSSTAG